MNQIGREMDFLAKMQQIVFAKRRARRMKNLALEPYNTAPEGNVPFNQISSAAGPGTAGSTVALLSFVVPNGYDGVIRWLINQYTGTNFVNNSGSLIWMVRVNGLYIDGYQNITSQFTGTTNGFQIDPGILVKSGQLIEVLVRVDQLFVPEGGSQLIAGLSGYYYPNAVARTN